MTGSSRATADGHPGTGIGQTLKTWTVMECLISVCGLAGVLLLSLVI